MLPAAAIESTVSRVDLEVQLELKHHTLQYLEAYFHRDCRLIFVGMEFQATRTSAFVCIVWLLII